MRLKAVLEANEDVTFYFMLRKLGIIQRLAVIKMKGGGYWFINVKLLEV